jgi:hypothetical protein
MAAYRLELDLVVLGVGCGGGLVVVSR